MCETTVHVIGKVPGQQKTIGHYVFGESKVIQRFSAVRGRAGLAALTL